MNQSTKLVLNWFDASHFGGGERLPPERLLAETLGLSRAALRKELAELEARGVLLRQIGRGTFVRPEAVTGSSRPSATAAVDGVFAGHADCSPRHLLSARLALEPQLARIAAREAAPRDLEHLREAERGFADAPDWPGFDDADAAFHRAIAMACGNPVLLHLFDQLALARQGMDWGRLRDRSGEGPPPSHAGIVEHAAIRAAIEGRDVHAAAAAVTHHLMVEAATILGGLV